MKLLKLTLGVAVVACCAGLVLPSTSFAQTTSSPSRVSAVSVRFAYGGNAAEIPATFLGHLILLPLRINESQPCLFLLDSTASSTSIDPGRAAELGIESGKSAVLELPGVALSFPVLPFVPKNGFAEQFGRIYEGTLGRDFFESVVIEIDYARKTVRLYDPAVYQYSGTGKSFHTLPGNAAPAVQAKVNAAKTLDGNFIIHTALDASVRFSDHYEETHHGSFSHLKTIPGPAQTPDGTGNNLGRLRLLEIGPFPIEGPIAEFAKSDPLLDQSNSKVMGEIGGGTLKRFIAIFDLAHEQIILSPNLEFHDEDKADMSGISLIAKGPGLRRFEVTQVRHGTPGSDAGVQKGDVIEGIDEDPAADLSLAQIRDLFETIDHPYKLTIDRNGATLTLTLKLRKLI